MIPQTDTSVIVLLLAPLFASLVSLLGKFISPRFTVIPAFALWFVGTVWALFVSGGALLNGDTLVYTIGGWAEPLGIALEVTGVTWIATIADLLIGTAAWLQTRRTSRFETLFYFFFFMALFSLQGVLYARDLFNLFVWFEVLSLSSFMLITYRRGRRTYLAALRYLLISTVSIVFFLFGVWVLYHEVGSLSLETITRASQRLSSGISHKVPFFFGSPLLHPPADTAGLAVALITVGILTRAAVVPFHTWLPEAHAAAPYPVSALLSGFVIKTPLLALWRIYEYISFPPIRNVLAILGCCCAFIGVLMAMVQKDAKKLLGYHSISQMGYIVAAFGIGGVAGQTASLFYIIGHALFKSLLFLTVGRVTDSISDRNVYTARGLGRSFPLTTLFYGVAAFSISGVPLFAGFTAKILVSKIITEQYLSILLTAAGIGTAASFFKLSRIFLSERVGYGRQIPSPQPTEKETNRLTAFFADMSMAVIAAGCLLMGVLPTAVYRFFSFLVASSIPSITDAIASSEATYAVLHWYTPQGVVKAVGTLAAGFFIALFLVSTGGKRISRMLRSYSLGINGSLRLLVGGVLLFLVLGMWTYGGG